MWLVSSRTTITDEAAVLTPVLFLYAFLYCSITCQLQYYLELSGDQR